MVVELPVEPSDLVVLAVGVVVATLGVTNFDARQQHGNALRKDQRGEKGALLFFPKLDNLRIVGRTFGAAVPTVVVVRTIAIIFAVFFVVLLVVGDQIVQREAVVTGNKVYARVWTTTAPFVED